LFTQAISNMSDQKSAEPVQYPKVLFVHDYRPDSRATADLIRQMLLGFPADKLEWWSCRQTELYDKPDLHASRLHEFVIPNKLVPHVRLSELKSVLVENLWVPRAARHLERVIAETKPDLVAALLYGWSVPVLGRVRWPAGQKLHVSVWDFPDTNGMKKVIGENRGRRFVSAIHGLVRRADSFDAISSGMLAELQTHTGRRDGLIVHSGFEPKYLEALESAPANQNQDDVIRLAYVGTIISETGFLNLLAALKNVRRTLPQKVVLEFFGGRNYRSRTWFEPDWMTEHGMFSDQGLVEALHRCSWGIVVMDPEGEDLRYSRFSFPNKGGTYLSAGVPILGLGHPECSLAHIMQEYRLGRFTSATDSSELEMFLAETLRVPAPRDCFRADILQCARTEFNAAELRARLWRTWGVR
jgi:glycosyltransferase involved in cell wall biosynthesis